MLNDPKQENEVFVGIREAAERLGVSLATIRRMTSRGDLRFYRFSSLGHRRFRMQDVEDARKVRYNIAA